VRLALKQARQLAAGEPVGTAACALELHYEDGPDAAAATAAAAAAAAAAAGGGGAAGPAAALAASEAAGRGRPAQRA
jgi:hypothetical protein